MTEFFPLMLVIARESRKSSQSALAKAAGVSQSALSQIEAGILKPTDDVIHRLADQLQYPVSLFGLSVRFQQLPMTFFRKKSRIGVRDVNAIRARVNLYRLRAEILLRGTEQSDTRVTLTDLAGEGLSPEDAAQRLRVYWNIPPGPIKDLTTLVEAHGIVVVPVDFMTAQVDGLSIYEPNDTLPPMIFMNPNQPADRWRLTLGHELAHIVLHHHLAIPSESKDMESEAFRFASEFLMPLREVSGHMRQVSMYRLAALKKHWGVSMQAILRRASAMGYVSERHARRFWIQLRRGAAEPVEIAVETPTLINSLVEKHLGELHFTQRDLSRALHQNLDEFKSDFGVAATHLRLA